MIVPTRRSMNAAGHISTRTLLFETCAIDDDCQKWMVKNSEANNEFFFVEKKIKSWNFEYEKKN